MRVFDGIGELEQAVGTQLGYSNWRTITQQRIDAFADATDDHQWIHVDRARATTGPFCVTVAHGFLTLSLLPVMLGEIYRIDGLSMGLNYGLNKLRFPAPVPVDARIRAGVELAALDSRANGTRLTSMVTVEIEGVDKPACVAEWVGLLVP